MQARADRHKLCLRLSFHLSWRPCPRMPPVVDLRSSPDPRDLVHRSVQALAEGQLLGVPTETGYVAAGYLLAAPAVQRLATVGRNLGRERLILALQSPQESLDYVPQVTDLGRKLMRRFWPGPVALLFPEVEQQAGLLHSVPAEVRQHLCPDRSLAMRVPTHEFVNSLLRLLAAPLVVVDDSSASGEIFHTAQALANASGDDLALVIDAGPPRHEQPTSLVRVDGADWAVIREGVAPRRTLTRLAGTMVLFVCTGNTCRSPMAEGLYRKVLADRLGCAEDELVDRGYMVVSAGVAAAPGCPSSPEAVEVLSERGVDISSHESQPVTTELLSQADQIFTMTRGHRELLLREFPELGSRVQLISRNGIDVVDPIGAGFKEYRRCADQIEKYVREIVSEEPQAGQS